MNQQENQNNSINNTENPYAAPETSSMQYQTQETDTINSDHFGLLSEPRKLGAGRGTTWLSSAFSIMKADFWTWIGYGLAYLVIMVLLSFVPFGGLLSFHFTGGVMYVCAKKIETNEFSFGDFFSVFQSHGVPLLIMALLYILGFIVFLIPIFIFAMIAGISGFNSDVSAGLIALLVIVMCFLFIPLMMAIWLAPPLIVLNNLKALEAMKLSLKGAWANIVPMIVFGLLIIVLFPLGVLFTLGLGYFVAIPLFLITTYTAYRDIWTTEMIDE